MTRRLVILTFWLLFINLTVASNKTLDSLFTELDKLVTDSVKIELYNDLSWEFNSSDPNKSLEYAHKAFKLSAKSNYLFGEAEAYNNFGNAFYFLSYFDTAVYFYNKSLTIREAIGDLKGASSTLSNLGTIYDIKGEYETAIAKFSKALELKEQIADTAGKINVLSNIGVMYMVLSQHETALEYFHKCLQYENNADTYTLANIYSNIGLIYYDYADTTKGLLKNEYFEVSLSYNNKAIMLRDSIKDYYGLSISYTNAANLYAHFKNYNKAIEFYNYSIEMQKDIEDINGLALNLHNLGRMYLNLKNFKEAIAKVQESQDISLKIGNTDFIKDNYKVFSEIYEIQGDLKKSLGYYKQYTSIKDSLLNLEAIKQLKKLKIGFKAQEAELKLLKKEEELKNSQLSKNKITNLGLILLVIISIVFAFILHGSLKRNKKTNVLLRKQNGEIREQRNQISSQKEEIENKNTILNETYQLLALKNKDITDSLKYARNIQEAILPDNNHVKKLLPKSFILFLPKDYVSGDFYWVEENWGKVFFAAADCTGHGVPGAFMSIVGYNLINKAITDQYLFKPSDILAYISKGFQISLSKHSKEYFLKAGMDIALCSLDKKQMTLEYSGAFNSLYIVRNGELIQYKADLYPIGRELEPKENYTNHVVQLQKNDMIYIFSDGFSDQFGGPHDRKFMTKRMKSALLAIYHLPPEQQKDRLEEIFYKWKKGNDQIDDVLVFGVRI